MSIPLMAAAMKAALISVTPGLALAEDGKVYKPLIDVPYQRLDFIWAAPISNENTSTYRQEGTMQVSLRFPAGDGPDAVEAQAMLIRAAFPRKRTITSGSIKILIERAPEMAVLPIDGDRIVRVVHARFYANDLT